MLVLLLSFVAIGIISSSELPLFTPFDLNQSHGYIINGTYCQNIFGPCANVSLVIDPPNNRMFIGLGQFGQYVILHNASYVFGLVFTPGVCSQVVGWNYSQQVIGWSGAASMPDSRQPDRSIFTGLVHDVGGCAHDLSLTVRQLNEFITELSFDQRVQYDATGNGTFICFLTKGSIEYSISTLDRHSSRAAYFVIPPECSTPIDYCAFAYPPGNPCAIPQKRRSLRS